MTKVWPDDFGRGEVAPITNTIIADLWVEVARARRAAGDNKGSAQANRNAKAVRTRRRETGLLFFGRRELDYDN